MGAFVGYSQREDMQEDTYTLVASALTVALMDLKNRNLQPLERDITVLYALVSPRLKRERREELKRRRNDLRLKLYGANPQTKTAFGGSRLLDEAEDLLLDIMEDLEKAGILFRIRTDPNALVAS